VADLLTPGEWTMPPGERAALQGIVAALRPRLAIEIGTWSGGSLEPISGWSEEVHSFDLERHPRLTGERFPNVTFHIGDSHELLPAFLTELAASGRAIDFALVDGDHSAAGVQADLQDLLDSECVHQTVILLHDTLNESVRAGLENVAYDAFEIVRFVDLDFIPGRVMREGPQKDEYWSGLGLIVTGDAPLPAWPRAYSNPDVWEAFSRTRVASGASSERLGLGQLLELEDDVRRQKALVQLMENSLSWRITAPLRRLKALGRR
jgi:Methyltransferase domain